MNDSLIDGPLNRDRLTDLAQYEVSDDHDLWPLIEASVRKTPARKKALLRVLQYNPRVLSLMILGGVLLSVWVYMITPTSLMAMLQGPLFFVPIDDTPPEMTTPSSPDSDRSDEYVPLGATSLATVPTPRYLPEGFSLRDSKTVPGRDVQLLYSGPDIPSPLLAISFFRSARPWLLEGTYRAITIGDSPGVLVDGEYALRPGQESPLWETGMSITLYFELDGWAVKVTGEEAGENENYWTESELIRIAESLRGSMDGTPVTATR